MRRGVGLDQGAWWNEELMGCFLLEALVATAAKTQTRRVTDVSFDQSNQAKIVTQGGVGLPATSDDLNQDIEQTVLSFYCLSHSLHSDFVDPRDLDSTLRCLPQIRFAWRSALRDSVAIAKSEEYRLSILIGCPKTRKPIVEVFQRYRLMTWRKLRRHFRISCGRTHSTGFNCSCIEGEVEYLC